MLRSNAKQTHVLVDLERHFHLVVLDTTNDERLVQGKVTLDASRLHHLLYLESLLNIALFAVALDHDAVSYQVWFAGSGCLWL